MVALHAAALDDRITRVIVERTLVSYRMAVEAGLHTNLSEVLVPNVLKHYDVGDLLMAIHPRPVVLVNSATPMGQLARESLVHEQLAAAIRHGPAPGRAEPRPHRTPRLVGSHPHRLNEQET
jgi:hypothetical protein